MFGKTNAPPIHQSFLVWRNGAYAKLAAILAILAILGYALERPGEPPNGGTPLGYAYGTLGLGLIAWLAWFGVRRRQYRKAGLLEDWLSAHVYLGLALLVVASLHTGFRFHWNVHTVAYVLMVLVIASGVYGVYTYWRYPTLMTENRAGATFDALATELAALDLQIRTLALNFDDELMAVIQRATGDDGGRFGPGEFLFGFSPNPLDGPTGEALRRLREEVSGSAGDAPRGIVPLVQALTQRAGVMLRIRRDWRYRALLSLWRAVHVPLTIGLLVALAIHVFSVFYYW